MTLPPWISKNTSRVSPYNLCRQVSLSRGGNDEADLDIPSEGLGWVVAYSELVAGSFLEVPEPEL
jgi:hypothetical protein